MRVAMIGGGGFRVPLVHEALAAAGVEPDEIVLQDVDGDRLAVMSAVLADPRVVVTTDLVAAVTDADLVFSAVRVGGTNGRVADERRALDLGVIGQETVGAGGILYAARAVPAAVAVAAAVAEHAPHAWLVSMTNPAGIVTEVSAAVLGDRAIGVCDSPTGLIRRACAALGVDVGPAPGSLPAEVEVDYAGINHLGWLRALRIDGEDRLPELLANPRSLQRIEEARLFGPDVIAALGCLPNEYLYWYYAAREAHAGVVRAGRTRAEHVRDEQERFYAAAAAEPRRARELWHAANDERNRSYFAELRDDARDEADVAAGGYESIAAALAHALTTDDPATVVLDVRNRGAVPGLPDDAVVEVACRVDAAGPRPLPVAALTLHQLGLTASVRGCERAVAEAALSGSRDGLVQAFVTHPLVGSLEAARVLAGLAGR